MVNEANDSYIGKQIKSYTILQKLGSGGFACVYLARNNLNELVAIKLLDSKYTVSEERQLLFQEAQFLQELKPHQYILPILEYGESEDTSYIVVEYAPGGTLRERINNCRPLAIADALTILTQIGEAIHIAHQRHIIHNDLKPENILFNDKGDAVLADFGIAVQLGRSKRFFGLPRGTYAYMAPEQFDGMFTKESDQYSLGCIAYELLTGRHPFESFPPFNPRDRRIMKERHKNAKARTFRELNNAIPAHMEQAIFQSLAKRPSERHDSIATFIRSLQLSTDLLSQSAYYFTRPLDTPAPYISSSGEVRSLINLPDQPDASSIGVEVYEIVQLNAPYIRALQNSRRGQPPGQTLPKNAHDDKHDDEKVDQKLNYHTEPPMPAPQESIPEKSRSSSPRNPLETYNLQLPGRLKTLLSPSLQTLKLTFCQGTVEDTVYSEEWKYTGITFDKPEYLTAKNDLVPLPNYALIYIPAEFFNENTIFRILSLFSDLTLIIFSDELGDPDLVVEKRLEEQGKLRKITWKLLRKKHIDDLKSKKPDKRRISIRNDLELEKLLPNVSVEDAEVEEERKSLEELLRIWKRNQKNLNKQKAQYGLSVPIELLNELENANSQVTFYEKSLANLPKSRRSNV